MARDVQNRRFKDSARQSVCNADMRAAEIRQFCKLDDAGQSLMRSATRQLQHTYGHNGTAITD